MFSMKYLIAFKISTNFGGMVKIGEGKFVITSLDQITLFTPIAKRGIFLEYGDNEKEKILKLRYFLIFRIMPSKSVDSLFLFFGMVAPTSYSHGHRCRNEVNFL